MRAGGPHAQAHTEALPRFEAMFRQNADAVMAYAARRSDTDTAQEVVAETFAVAWRRLDVVPDAALPWLLGVARKVLSNERRSRSRAEALNVRIVRESVEFSDDPADVVGARLSAQAALDGLLPAEREVLELIAWEGLSAAHVAETLGCSRVAVTVRMHRARRRFLRLLDHAEAQTLLGGSTEIRRRQPGQSSRAASMEEADDAR